MPPIRTYAPALGAFLILGYAAVTNAAGIQRLDAVRKVVENFVRQQTTELPGQVNLIIGAIDPRLRLPACDKPEAFVPVGNRLWGNTTVGVRCSAETPWTIYVPVTVKVMGQIVVAAHPLATGQAISQADLLTQEGDLTQLPTGVLSEPGQALGKTISASVAAGQPLRLDMLRAQVIIHQGQTVKVIAQGQGFRVSSEGKALSSAAIGQSVSVRTSSGQIVSGTVRANGIVEVPF